MKAFLSFYKIQTAFLIVNIPNVFSYSLYLTSLSLTKNVKIYLLNRKNIFHYSVSSESFRIEKTA